MVVSFQVILITFDKKFYAFAIRKYAKNVIETMIAKD